MKAGQRPPGIWRNLCFARAERGMALPIVLLAVAAVLGVLAIVSLHVSALERSADEGSLESTMAFYAVEAGRHNVSSHSSDRLVSAWVLRRV